MICPYCGKKTSDQKLKCEHCEKTINKECPQCAEIVKAKAKVCRYCGFEFEETEKSEEKKSGGTAIGAIRTSEKIANQTSKKTSTKSKSHVLLPIVIGVFVVATLLCVSNYQTVINIWNAMMVDLGLVMAPATEAPAASESGSNSGSDVGSNSGSSPASSSASLVLTPLVERSSGPTDSGWTLYDVVFTLENQSSDFLPIGFDTGTGTVSTQEGFTYQGDPLHFTSMTPMQFGNPLLLPPGFRVVGSTDNYNGYENIAIFQFMAANNSHPTSIDFANYGTVSIADITIVDSLTDYIASAGQFLFPTDLSRSSFLDLGITIQVPDKANVTFADAYLSEYGIFRGLTIDVALQNLNAGYENSLEESCYMIDGLGFIRWNIASTNFYMGPGQAAATTLGFYLWNPTAAYNGTTDVSDEMVSALLNNAKIVCTGEFQAVFNLN